MADEVAEATPRGADTQDQEQVEDMAELRKKYLWVKIPADAATAAGVYYIKLPDGTDPQWEEPKEPYWVWNVALGDIDAEKGLQQPKGKQAAEEDSQTEETDPANQRDGNPTNELEEGEIFKEAPSKTSAGTEYRGYNPAIHGDYDPKADYANWHKEKWAKEEAARHPAPIPTADEYAATMQLNRFTGTAQGARPGPEHHSDAAKSNRQLNAFFDVQAAANSNEGRSLKAERKEKKLTKEEVQAFNKQRAERKRKKRMAFLTS
ncbi:hypothetical protein TI39_contig685g00007 [Zymoseptoria brevis]|uniref:WW domain-containing protein n=1 Tax=Zymoseptoria brevis TaxID=1047168 RepID=A0A0F4GG65_9PEZI|nr:hypothetical protein TI39_contig685g00007 [Zymoseptoria brevis]